MSAPADARARTPTIDGTAACTFTTRNSTYEVRPLAGVPPDEPRVRPDLGANGARAAVRTDSRALPPALRGVWLPAATVAGRPDGTVRFTFAEADQRATGYELAPSLRTSPVRDLGAGAGPELRGADVPTFEVAGPGGAYVAGTAGSTVEALRRARGHLARLLARGEAPLDAYAVTVRQARGGAIPVCHVAAAPDAPPPYRLPSHDPPQRPAGD